MRTSNTTPAFATAGLAAFLLFGMAYGIGCSSDPSSGPSDGDAQDGGRPDSGTQDGGAPDGDAGRSPSCEVPSEKGALFAYLKGQTYRAFPRESKVHASDGPHGGNVRTYVTTGLEASLGSGSAEHPQCAAAVKELYGNGTTNVTGYAVAVKLAAASAEGKNWYFYETFDANTGSSAIEGVGVSLCADCHGGGRDFVLTPYPLQ